MVYGRGTANEKNTYSNDNKMAKVVRIFDAAGALRAEVWRGLLARVDSIDCKNHRDWDISCLVGLNGRPG